VSLNVREPGDRVDIDEMPGTCETELQERDEALAAREHLGVLAQPGQQRGGLSDGGRRVVIEASGNHGGVPSLFWSEENGNFSACGPRRPARYARRRVLSSRPAASQRRAAGGERSAQPARRLPGAGRGRGPPSPRPQRGPGWLPPSRWSRSIASTADSASAA